MRLLSFPACTAVLALTIYGTGGARAEDCSKAETTLAMNECAAKNYKAADADLNRIFARALVVTKESDRDIQAVEDDDRTTVVEGRNGGIVAVAVGLCGHGLPVADRVRRADVRRQVGRRSWQTCTAVLRRGLWAGRPNER